MNFLFLILSDACLKKSSLHPNFDIARPLFTITSLYLRENGDRESKSADAFIAVLTNLHQL